MAKFDLQKFKAKIKQVEVPYKKPSYIEVNDTLKEVIGLPGFPMGHVVQIFGLSDTGKSSLGFHVAAQAIKQDILVIFIITEGKTDWDRAGKMGVDKDHCIVESAEFLEDIFKIIDKYTALQSSGELPKDVYFIVDSIGNAISEESIKINKDGSREQHGAMMKAAKVLREKMRIYSHVVNNTRKETCPVNTGLLFLNHARKEPATVPGQHPKLVPYGGDGIWFAATLVLKTSASKKVEAIVNGKKIKFGLTTKIAVDKNHISHVSNSADFIITAYEIIPNDKDAIEDYKTRHKDEWKNAEMEETEE